MTMSKLYQSYNIMNEHAEDVPKCVPSTARMHKVKMSTLTHIYFRVIALKIKFE